jgi:hypothetical protein
MDTFTKEELEEALQTFSSLIHKCEKAQKSFAQGTPQWTTLNRRINASRIASALVTKLLMEN